MPLNHYVTLGRTGLRVSPICLGTMTFGKEWGWGSDPDESVRIIDRFLEKGGNFFDTANFYTHGHSEKILGDHLGKDKSKRERVVLATKFFGSMAPGDPNAGGAGRKSIAWACEESLRRLQTDYIDLYWMHAWDYHTPVEETLRTLNDLISAGKIRYFGFSDTPAWKVAQAQTIASFRNWEPLAAIQIEYSLLERTVEGELVPAARELGLGIVPWSPLKSGILSGKYTRSNRETVQPRRGEWVKGLLAEERTYEILDVLFEVAREANSTPARVALNWLHRQSGVTAPIIGARTIEQLDDNLAALDVELTLDQLSRLSQVSRPKLNFPAEFLTASASFRNPEITINGEATGANPLAAPAGQSY